MLPRWKHAAIKCFCKVKYCDSRIAFESEVLAKQYLLKRAKFIYPFELASSASFRLFSFFLSLFVRNAHISNRNISQHILDFCCIFRLLIRIIWMTAMMIAHPLQAIPPNVSWKHQQFSFQTNKILQHFILCCMETVGYGRGHGLLCVVHRCFRFGIVFRLHPFPHGSGRHHFVL